MGTRPAAKLGGVIAALSILVVPTVAGEALAAGEGLPRTYDALRVDSPQPALAAAFGRGMASTGDVNGDGEDDLLLPQVAGSPNGEGEVFVISGQTGAVIDTIVAPDPGNPTNVAGNNKAGFGSFWTSRIGSNRGGPGSFTDLASCPGGTSGVLCPNAIGAPDGIPEIVVGARGVDARGLKDSGRVYVYDGATRALLKRIDQPAADTTPLALSVSGGTNFGRTALNPSGLTACAGNFGLGTCPTLPRAVEIGDTDGQGRPDLVIGAPAHTEDATTAQPGSHCARTPGARCALAGRVYVYRGEEIVGSRSQEVLDGTTDGQSAGGTVIPETFTRIRNPAAQADDSQSSVNVDNEQLGNTLTAIGDVGRCNAVIAPGETCPRASSDTALDGIPDIVVPAPGVDLPIDTPEPAFGNAGVLFLIDGATRSVLSVYPHPERQLGSTFGSQLGSHEPAAGDLGSTTLPDIYAPSPGQNTTLTSAGRGYVLNGNFKGGSSTRLIARLDDPTPNLRGNFGGGSAGVGDLVGGAANPANELLVGTEGFTSSPSSDVHFFNAATEKVLQTVPDPDRQAGSGFGGAIVPLQDLNEDGFLDFAVSAENYTGSTGAGEGRMYILRSDNSPAPQPPSPPPPPRILPPPASGCAAGTAAGVTCVRNAAGGLTITGTAAANRIVGSSGRDVIRCGDGDDVVFAGAGDDEIRCGAGNDTIDAGTGNDLADGESGNDRLSGGPGGDRLVGGSGNDTVGGGSGNDVIGGGSGNDSMSGNEGSDRISGDGGGDRVNGNEGNDSISGGAASDRLVGNSGNDRIAGAGGNDTLSGNSGNDRLSGGSGRDSLVAGTGRDRLSGGSGNDRLNTRDRRGGDSANCGESRRDLDRASVNSGDRVRGCERVARR